MVVDYHESRRALALAELSACFAELVASPTDMKVLVDPNLQPDIFVWKKAHSGAGLAPVRGKLSPCLE